MNIEEESVIQFKLVTGEDVIAQVKESEVAEFYVVDAALIIEPLEDEYDDLMPELQSGRAYYCLRPFVAYTDDLEEQCSLNPMTIVCLTRPSPSVMGQYISSVLQIQESLGKSGTPETKVVPTEPQSTASNVVSLKPKQLLTED